MKNPNATLARPTRGFALIVTLSLMILLTVIAVSLLSLSSISLRASSQSSDMNAARSNARMSLMLAIGELQKAAGLDTRVTARADLIAEDKPPVLGVWKSWEGTDHNTDGRPIAPDYSSNKNARFIGWLTSASQTSTMAQIPDTKNGALKAKIVGDGTVDTTDPDKKQIYLTPTTVTVNQRRGAFAWWISGENQKARVPRPYEPTSSDAASWSILAKTHSVADTAPFGLDSLLTHSTLRDPSAIAPGSKALSIKQVDLLGGSIPKVSQESFHDLSATSVGLLTNTATGGWRKDLSLVTENWESSSLSSSGLPFFRVTPEKDLLYTRPTGDPFAAKSILYPWADYRRGTVTGALAPIYRFPPIGSWAHLARYATLYKNVFPATGSGNAMATAATAEPISGDPSNFIHKVRILPVISRVQWIYSHRAVASPTVPGKFDLNLVVQPVITLWNPYNVTLSVASGLTINLAGSPPPVITYRVGGVALPKKFTLQADRMSAAAKADNITGATPGPTNYTLASIPSFAPGETRVYSANGGVALTPGYRPNGGISYPIAKGGGQCDPSRR